MTQSELFPGVRNHGQNRASIEASREHQPRKGSQQAAVLACLRRGPCTGMMLVNNGCGIRYSARIFELRYDYGHKIITKQYPGVGACYVLEDK